MSRKINILYVIDYFHRTGGTERHLAQLVRHLPKDTFNCSIVVFDLGADTLLDDVRAAGVPVTHVPVAREYSVNAILRATELSRIIRTGRIDIVQTFHQKSDTYGAVIAALSGAKHIVSSKRDIAQLKTAWHFFLNRRFKGLFERFIVVADAVGDVIVDKEGIERSRISRIYNGVDQCAFRPPSREDAGQARSRLGLAANDFVVGMVAAFRPEKNHDVFFAGAIAARRLIPEMKLLVVGGGPLLERYRARFREDAAIVFAGDVSDVAAPLRAMDVGCLLPGSNEGFSNSILEKMAMGLPLIVTDVGGNAEAVIDGHNGFVISPLDVEAFRRALVDMHADPERRGRMGKRSRRLVEERFTLEAMCKSHEMLYLSLVGASRSQEQAA